MGRTELRPQLIDTTHRTTTMQLSEQEIRGIATPIRYITADLEKRWRLNNYVIGFAGLLAIVLSFLGASGTAVLCVVIVLVAYAVLTTIIDIGRALYERLHMLNELLVAVAERVSDPDE